MCPSCGCPAPVMPDLLFVSYINNNIVSERKLLAIVNLRLIDNTYVAILEEFGLLIKFL